jgi:hypothetical protein
MLLIFLVSVCKFITFVLAESMLLIFLVSVCKFITFVLAKDE